MSSPSAAGKSIVVTGASSGLGRSIAILAGRRGANVALIARRSEMLTAVGREINAAGGTALVLPLDISQPRAVIDSFSTITSQHDKIDILFNAAGTVEPVSRITDTSDLEFLNSFKTNVFGLFLIMRETLRVMNRQKDAGTIMNITSGAGINPYIGWAAYGSQKAAVNMLTKVAALETENKNVRIAAVSPGPFESGMQQIVRKTDSRQFPSRDKFVELYESGRLPSPDIIAPVLLDIALTDWPELSGTVNDLRNKAFQRECIAHGVTFDKDLFYS
jgi:benzil reductase ((S)-benzoin forming)